MTNTTVNKSGAGQLSLALQNLFQGAFNINAGTVFLAGADTLGTAVTTVSVASGAVLDIGAQTNTRTYPLTLAGTGLASAPKGALISSTGTGTWVGPITIASGGASIGGGAGTLTLSSTATINTAGNTLTLTQGATRTTTTGPISGSGSVVVTGIGSTGDWADTPSAPGHTYTGGTTLQAGSQTPVGIGSTGVNAGVTAGPFGTGTLIMNGGNMRSGSGGPFTVGNTVTLSGDTTFYTNASEQSLSFAGTVTLVGGTRTLTSTVGLTVPGTNVIFTGAIGDGGNNFGLVKTGLGNLTLARANTYTSATTVNIGPLFLQTGSIASSNLTLAGGTTLNMSNGAANPIPSSTLTTLNIGSVGATTTIIMDVGSSTATSDSINAFGSAAVAGNIVFNIAGLSGFGTSSTYVLLSAGSGLAPVGVTYSLSSVPGGFTYSLSVSDTSVTLNVTPATIPSPLYWRGAVSTKWSGVNGSSSNWTTDPAGLTNAGVAPVSTTDVIFSASNTGSGALSTTLDNFFSIKSLTFSAIPTGITSVTVAPGASPNYSLTVTPVASTTGITVATGGGATTISAPIVMNANQTWTNNDTTLFTVSGAVTGTGNALTISNPNTGSTTVSGSISNVGAISITNAGAGSTSFSGATIGSTGTALNISNMSTGGTTISDAITNIGAITISNANSGSTTLSGAIGGTGGSVSVSNASTGTTTISGANTFAGGLSMNSSGAGALIVTDSSTALTGSVNIINNGFGTGTVTLTAGTLNLRNNGDGTTSAQTLTYNNPFVIGGTALTINADRQGGSATTKTLNLASSSLGAGLTITLSNGDSYIVGLGDVTLNATAGGITTLAPNGTATATLRNVTGSATGGNVDTLVLGGTTVAQSFVTGAITDGAGGGTVALKRSTNATDRGNWTLSGTASNTYSGSTTIAGGTTTNSDGLILAKTGGAKAISGNTVLFAGAAFGNLYIGSATVPTAATFDDQFNHACTLDFTNAASHQYFQLMGSNQYIGGLISAANQNGVVENTETLANSGLNSILTVDVSGSNVYSYVGFMRDKSSTGSGTLSIVKKGTGTQILGGTQISQTGITTISAGTLGLNGATIWASPVNFDAGSTGTLSIFSATQSIPSLSTTDAVDNNVFVQNDSSVNAVLTVSQAGNTSFGGVLQNNPTADTFGLIKSGAGNLTLNNANTYTGTTQVLAGNLTAGTNNIISSSNAQGITVNATGAGITATFDCGAFNQMLNGVTALNLGGTTATSTPVVAGAGGTLTIGGDVVYTATNNPLGGVISVSTLDLNNTTRTFTVGDSTSATNDLSVSSIIRNGSLIKAGAGTLNLSGINTYAGGTTLNAGTILMSGSGTLGNTSSNLTTTAGTLDLNGTSQSVGTLSGTAGTITNGGAAATFTFGNGNGSGTFAGVLAAGATTLNVTKTGSGTVTLTGTNTFTGNLTVTGGLIAFATSPAGSSPLGNTVTVNLNGGGISYTAPGTTALNRSVAIGAGNGTLDVASSTGTLTTASVTSSGGSLIKTGTGTLQISGSTTLNGGAA